MMKPLGDSGGLNGGLWGSRLESEIWRPLSKDAHVCSVLEACASAYV